ncbi:hypothetical protein NGRA_1354 [Nosema granulosis]|uniref:Uncharacterized protein n=1 Tax=Nosema granulosis TaxID=83296 RepID=A0A9P6GZ41_9MICR|nr:hypothetical protein NGRA_1354 [Nosema granulosis]
MTKILKILFLIQRTHSLISTVDFMELFESFKEQLSKATPVVYFHDTKEKKEKIVLKFYETSLIYVETNPECNKITKADIFSLSKSFEIDFDKLNGSLAKCLKNISGDIVLDLRLYEDFIKANNKKDIDYIGKDIDYIGKDIDYIAKFETLRTRFQDLISDKNVSTLFSFSREAKGLSVPFFVKENDIVVWYNIRLDQNQKIRDIVFDSTALTKEIDNIYKDIKKFKGLLRSIVFETSRGTLYNKIILILMKDQNIKNYLEKKKSSLFLKKLHSDEVEALKDPTLLKKYKKVLSASSALKEDKKMAGFCIQILQEIFKKQEFSAIILNLLRTEKFKNILKSNLEVISDIKLSIFSTMIQDFNKVLFGDKENMFDEKVKEENQQYFLEVLENIKKDHNKYNSWDNASYHNLKNLLKKHFE